MNRERDKPATPIKGGNRRDRQAQALRDNLKKRKAQQRARRAPASPGEAGGGENQGGGEGCGGDTDRPGRR